ncbi:hypothetical protein Tco_1105568 [Tanacetum coccineum]
MALIPIEETWVIPGTVYHDLYLGGKALIERENVGFDLTKSDFCPSFVEDLSANSVGLRVADSHTGNHREDGFTPLETIRRFLGLKRPKASTFRRETGDLGNVRVLSSLCPESKELFVWSPSFKDVPEKELFSDDESAKINEQANTLNNDGVENASEVVSDTYFGDNGEVQGFEHQHGESNDKEHQHGESDPFNIYDLLDKRTKEVRTTDTSTSILYPPGFTPANDIPACNNQDIPEAKSDRPPSRSARSNSRVLEEAENSVDRVS